MDFLNDTRVWTWVSPKVAVSQARSPAGRYQEAGNPESRSGHWGRRWVALGDWPPTPCHRDARSSQSLKPQGHPGRTGHPELRGTPDPAVYL
jgi:hypothetical protein